MIGLIAVTMAGRASAARLAEAWPGETRGYDGPARQALHRAWAECDGMVCFLAVGATTRLVAPLLDSKWFDPAVVCVDEPGRYAVTLVGGHAAGANALCTRVADVLGAQAIITTATDASGLPVPSNARARDPPQSARYSQTPQRPSNCPGSCSA